jgi:hypothetical protein
VKFFFQPIYTNYANLAYFDKRSHLNLLLWNRWTKWNQIWQGWSPRRLLWEFPIGSYVKISSAVVAILVGGMKCRTKFLKDHPRITSAKFGWDWLSSFRGEDFWKISSPLFSNLHNRSKSAKVQSS